MLTRFLIFFLVFVGCSPSALKVERAIAPGILTVIQLSDNGSIGQTLDQLPLTETIAGPSEIVIRDGRIYIASYKQFSIVGSDTNGKLRLLSSLPLAPKRLYYLTFPHPNTSFFFPAKFFAFFP